MGRGMLVRKKGCEGERQSKKKQAGDHNTGLVSESGVDGRILIPVPILISILIRVFVSRTVYWRKPKRSQVRDRERSTRSIEARVRVHQAQCQGQAGELRGLRGKQETRDMRHEA
jgi:hypothetical protein